MDNILKWYEKSGKSTDVVSSTRIRLARNLLGYPFPIKATSKQKAEVEEKTKEALLSGNSILSKEFSFISLDTLSDEEAVSLVERHMVSPEFISNRRGKAILSSENESISIMINEEDHLRIQVIHEGLSLQEAAETADRIDTLLGESLNFAFDREFGYLTQCPTNLGTGMRASVMLHLPALSENDSMSRIASNLSKLGLTIRGTYGEGTNVVGSLYQLSNQLTLGLSEKEAIDNLNTITLQLIDEERKTRKEMSENIILQDKINRAAGVLKSAKMLSCDEFMGLVSYLRFGLSTGLMQGLSDEELSALSVGVQPATLMARTGQTLSQNERDILRAKMTREVCAKIKE